MSESLLQKNAELEKVNVALHNEVQELREALKRDRVASALERIAAILEASEERMRQ